MLSSVHEKVNVPTGPKGLLCQGSRTASMWLGILKLVLSLISETSLTSNRERSEVPRTKRCLLHR